MIRTLQLETDTKSTTPIPIGLSQSAKLRVTATSLAIALVCVALAVGGSKYWGPVLLVIGPSWAAWTVRRMSLLVSFYLAQIPVYYGLTSLVLGQNPPPVLTAIVVLWTVGLAVGALAGRDSRASGDGIRWSAPRWPQVIMTMGLIAIQASLALSGLVGFVAQLASGLVTPTGVVGILTAAAPVVSLMLIITALRSERHVYLAAMVLVLEAGVLSLSGFRGAAAVFVVAVIFAAALTLPKASPWRNATRATIVVSGLALVAAMGFIVAANIRSGVATELGASSQGTQLFSADQALPVVAGRLDLGPPLQAAINYQDDPYVEDALSWTSQVQAFIPRFLWPDKPIIDYGQRVSATIYGLTYGQSSSTISTIGDILINFKILGVAIVAFMLGLALTLAERRIHTGGELPSLVLAAALSYALVGQEAPLIVTAAGFVRNLIVASILWRASQAVYHVISLDSRR